MEHFHLSPHENILTIALITIHYLYTNDALSSRIENMINYIGPKIGLTTFKSIQHLLLHDDLRRPFGIEPESSLL